MGRSEFQLRDVKNKNNILKKMAKAQKQICGGCGEKRKSIQWRIYKTPRQVKRKAKEMMKSKGKK